METLCRLFTEKPRIKLIFKVLLALDYLPGSRVAAAHCC